MPINLKIRKRYLYNIVSKSIPVFGDAAIVYCVFVLAYFLRFYSPVMAKLFPVVKGIPSWQIYQNTFIGISFAFMITFIFSGMYYRRFLGGFDEFVQVLKSVTLATVLITAVTFLYREFEYSRLVIAFAWLLSTFIVFIFHEIVKYTDNFLLYKFFGPRRVHIIGNGKTTDVFRRYFKDDPKHKVYYSEKLSEIEGLSKFCKEKKIDELIITSLRVRHEDLSAISNICDDYSIDFRIVPDILELRMGELIIDSSFGLPLLRIKPVSLYGANRLIKRIFDVVVSVVFLGIFVMPLALVAVFIKIETLGSIFYVRKRVGYKGNMFPFFKFRSMVDNADELLENLKGSSERSGPVFKMKNDPRVTMLGKILRKLSLDELPQIINVLRGDMSIIGPRPQVIWEAESYDEFARKRLNVLPGITGLWQVSGRASLSYEDMIRLDIFYIENWSLGLDLKILLKTIPTVLSGEGAY